MFFSSISGGALEHSTELILKKIPILLLVIPAFINVSGDLADVFCARTSSKLYSGELDTRFRPFNTYILDLLAIMLVSFIAFTSLSLLSLLLNVLIFKINFNFLIFYFVVVASGTFTTFIVGVGGSFLTLGLFKRGADIDSIIPPITTTIGDMIGTVTLMFLANLFF